MNHGLVVVDDTETHRSLLETAGELAEGADANLLLFSPVDEESFAARCDAMAGVQGGGRSVYGVETARQQAVQRARELAMDLLDDRDVEYEIVPQIVSEKRLATAIVDAAESNDCDHVFITGERRSPTGKAIFGDLAQSIMLAFDGQVTVELE